MLAAEENGQLPTSVNKETYALLYSILKTRVQKGKLIILDAVNASIDHIKDSLDLAEQAGYRIVYYQMPTSLDSCLEIISADLPTVEHRKRRLGGFMIL